MNSATLQNAFGSSVLVTARIGKLAIERLIQAGFEDGVYINQKRAYRVKLAGEALDAVSYLTSCIDVDEWVLMTEGENTPNHFETGQLQWEQRHPPSLFQLTQALLFAKEMAPQLGVWARSLVPALDRASQHFQALHNSLLPYNTYPHGLDISAASMYEQEDFEHFCLGIPPNDGKDDSAYGTDHSMLADGESHASLGEAEASTSGNEVNKENQPRKVESGTHAAKMEVRRVRLNLTANRVQRQKQSAPYSKQ